MKKVAVIILFITFFFLSSSLSWAKLLPRFKSSGGGKAASSVAGPAISARLRSDRKALILNLGNLNKVSSLVYTLYYQTNNMDQGVSGSVDMTAETSMSRELLFGTCSPPVCVYHENITNMKLEVTYELMGIKRLRRFRIRV